MANIKETTVTVLVKKVYGIERYYPHDLQAERIAKLANQTTLTEKELRLAKEMGFELVFLSTWGGSQLRLPTPKEFQN